MIQVLAWPTVLALVGWIAGFNVLRHLAAAAVEREGATTYLDAILKGGWRRGTTRPARWWRNAAFAWFVLAPPLMFGGLVAWWLQR